MLNAVKVVKLTNFALEMEWVRPEILWGLFSVIIPVLIHLLQLRRFKTVSFSNVSFLENVQNETKSTQRLRNLLLLLIRTIAVVALVTAFAGPYIPYSGNVENKGSMGNVVSVYLDTSPSIDALGEQGPILQVEKTRASEIVDNYSETDNLIWAAQEGILIYLVPGIPEY